MASPFAFAWMLLKDSARVGGPDGPRLSDEELAATGQGRIRTREDVEPVPFDDVNPMRGDYEKWSQPQHPPMPRPEDEGPTMGEMADMSPEEKEFVMSMARRRNAPKPEDPAQTTLHDFD